MPMSLKGQNKIFVDNFPCVLILVGSDHRLELTESYVRFLSDHPTSDSKLATANHVSSFVFDQAPMMLV